MDASDDTLGAKVRATQTGKVPYALVVGATEADARSVAVRPYRGAQRKDVPLEDLVAEIAAEIAERRVPEPT